MRIHLPLDANLAIALLQHARAQLRHEWSRRAYTEVDLSLAARIARRAR